MDVAIKNHVQQCLRGVSLSSLYCVYFFAVIVFVVLIIIVVVAPVLLSRLPLVQSVLTFPVLCDLKS